MMTFAKCSFCYLFYGQTNHWRMYTAQVAAFYLNANVKLIQCFILCFYPIDMNFSLLLLTQERPVLPAGWACAVEPVARRELCLALSAGLEVVDRTVVVAHLLAYEICIFEQLNRLL
jgi:hypothetical protein